MAKKKKKKERTCPHCGGKLEHAPLPFVQTKLYCLNGDCEVFYAELEYPKKEKKDIILVQEKQDEQDL